MTFSRTLMLAGLCLVSAQAFAQWQWVGSDGRKVFSDRPPPADVPESRILKSPASQLAPRPATGSTATTPRVVGRNTNAPQYGDVKEPPKAATTPAPAASAPASAASVPKDKALEEKAKKAEAAEAAKRKAEEERIAGVRAENCRRAKEAKASLSSGMPLAKVDGSGKQVMVDEATRAAELKRAEGIIATDC